MNTSLERLLTSAATVAEALGWALIHSLWQGALIAAALFVSLALLRHRSAALRHAACLCALLALMLLTARTAWQLRPASVAPSTTGASTAVSISETFAQSARDAAPAAASRATLPDSTRPADHEAATHAPAPASQHSWRERVEPWLPWISALWLLGVAGSALRHCGGWWRVRALRRRGEIARPEWQQACARLAERFGLRGSVRLLESADSAGPMLAGLFRPVVLLPARLATGLSAAELEAILAHELAHLARRDAWSNFGQLAIETLFFYHPAVWWIGHRARQEREHAADDLALRVCTDRRLYAGALTRLAELQLIPSPALAATGGNLLARIRRIVQPNAIETPVGGWSLGIPVLLTALALAGILHVRADEAKTTPVSSAKPATSDARGAGSLFEVWPAERKIELTLVPQAVEFEGFIHYGSPIETTSTNSLAPRRDFVEIEQSLIWSASRNWLGVAPEGRITTSIGIFDGETVIVGGHPLAGVLNVVSPSTKDQPLTKTLEEPPRDTDDAKAWVDDAFQLDDKPKREAAIERIRVAMTSGNADEARTGITAFTRLGPIEFDKASFRPAVRALLASSDVATRAKAASAFTMTGAEPEDLPRIFALAEDPAPEVREYLAGVIVQLTNRDLRDKAASDAILKLMANLPRDSRSVGHAMWGVKLSPEIEARVLEFCREIDHASNSSVGYNFFYGTLSTQANKSEASCQRLIELLAHQDTTNIAGRSAWGLQQGVDRAQFPLVADAMMKVIEARSDGNLRNNALRNLRAYGNAAQAPALKAMLAKPGVTGELRKTLEDMLAELEARPVADAVALSSTENQQPKPQTPETMKLNNTALRNTAAALAIATGVGTAELSAEEAAQLREKVAALEKRISELEGGATSERKLERLLEENKLKARKRGAEDRQKYKPEELSEIESLYQVANKNWRTEEARESLKKLLAKYDRANRTGCATLYMGQMSEGQERIDYLTRAVEKFSDCYYFDGCQVGGYGRYVLALTLWEKGDKDKARALLAELKTTYKDATDHRGRPMGEIAEAAEKELAAKQ